jgi:1,4-dihydroxy-6-naphthoate synthase
MQEILSIAISPCPNDTFIFENIYNGKISVEDCKLEFHFHDIDVLNRYANEAAFDIIKISFANYKNICDNYVMLESGGAMGYGVGPLLVKKVEEGSFDAASDLSLYKVAIPGKNTTANFLLSYLFPEINESQKIVMSFDAIEDWVNAEQNRLGLLIHEGRFTYKAKGLALVADLGQLWEEREQLPIPLGCIVAKKTLGKDLLLKIETAINNSITNYDDQGDAIISDFIKMHAQEMDEAVMRQHIDLYVNDFSKNMGEKGLETWRKMEEVLNRWS